MAQLATSKIWGDLEVTQTVTISGSLSISQSASFASGLYVGGTITVNEDIFPVSNNVSELGASGKIFKNGYFGTVSASYIEGPSGAIEFKTAGTTELYLYNIALRPGTDNGLSLGTDSIRFKDGYFNGTVSTTTASISGNIRVAGQLRPQTGPFYINFDDSTNDTLIIKNIYGADFMEFSPSSEEFWGSTDGNIIIGKEDGTKRFGKIFLGHTGTNSYSIVDLELGPAQTGDFVECKSNGGSNVLAQITSAGVVAGSSFKGKDSTYTDKFEMVWNATLSSIDFNYL